MPTVIPHLSSLIRSEDVWNFAEIEDVVDILQEQLILQLVVIEEEHPAGDVRAELLQNPLQVVPPVFETVKEMFVLKCLLISPPPLTCRNCSSRSCGSCGKRYGLPGVLDIVGLNTSP